MTDAVVLRTSGEQFVGASSGGEGKVGLNAFMISGSQVLASLAVGAIVRVSGETVIAKVSGETVVATLRTSGGDAPSAGGGLDLARTPLAVLVVSGSITGAAGAGADPVTIRSGTMALFASGMGLFTAKSGSLDPNVIPLHVLVVSGSIAGAGATSVTTLSGSLTRLLSGSTTQIHGPQFDLVAAVQQANADNLAALNALAVVTWPLAFDGSAFPRIRVTKAFGVTSGLPLAVGFASGWGDAVRVSGETVIAKISGETVVAKVSGETVVAQISGQPVLIGQFLPYLTSGEENTALIASGATAKPLVDQKGLQVVRIDRVHVSGGFARYDRNIVTAQGDTVLETPGSGRALRLKAVQDSYMGNSGTVLVAYRFGAAPAAHFLRHQVGANFPNWGMNLVGAEIQGAVGAELRMNLNVALSSGVEFTTVLEEVGSGALF